MGRWVIRHRPLAGRPIQAKMYRPKFLEGGTMKTLLSLIKRLTVHGSRFTVFLLLLTSHFSFPTFLFAEEKIEKIEEIVITATRIEEAIEDIPASVTIITKEGIEDSTATNVTEVLRDVTDLKVTEYGKRGSIALPRLRGSTAGQVLVLLDGRRLNPPASGQFDLNDLPVSVAEIERIEILRGASSALYGADALGGVINIVTKKPKEPYTNFSASYGRFDTQAYSLTTSGKLKALGYLLSVSKESSEGFRPNSNYDLTALNGKIGFDLTPKSYLDLSISYLDKDAGIPGSIKFPSPRAKQTDENTLIGLTYTGKYSEKLDVITKLYRNYYRLGFKDPDILAEDTHKNTNTVGEIQLNYLYNPSNLLTGGIEIGREDLESTSTGNHDRSRRGLFLQDEIRFGNSVTIIPGARYDAFTPGKDQLSPKISSLYKLSDARFRASIAKGYRIPTFNELYWPDTVWASGNPDLRPERSIEYEIGWDQTFSEKVRTKTTAFRRDVKDLITWQPDSTSKWIPLNIGKARIEGIEIEGEIDINKSLSFGLNYTYLNPEDRNTGEKIPNQPKHQFNSSVRASYPFGLGVSLNGRYTKNYGDPPSYFVMDGKITQKVALSSRFKGDAFLGVKNIFDKKYEVVKDYPMPPREFYGGFSITF